MSHCLTAIHVMDSDASTECGDKREAMRQELLAELLADNPADCADLALERELKKYARAKRIERNRVTRNRN